VKALTETFTVAVGQKSGAFINSFIYSYDGITWNPSPSDPTIFANSTWTVVWNGKQWLAGGDADSPIAYSPDGINWTRTVSSIFGTNVQAIGWNGSYWIAIGFSSGTVGYSYNGISWTSSGTLSSVNAKSLVWNGILWVAGGQNGAAYSYDGTIWINMNTQVASTNCVAWNGILWLAGGGTISYSYDGIVWTASSSATSVFTQGVGGLGWNGSLWVAGGGNFSVSTMGYSTDGINWTKSESGSTVFTSGIIESITWNGSFWIAGGIPAMGYSYDGIVWSRLQSASALMNDCRGVTSRNIVSYIPPVIRANIINRPATTIVALNTIKAYMSTAGAMWLGTNTGTSINVYGQATITYFGSSTSASTISLVNLNSMTSAVVVPGTGNIGDTITAVVTDTTNGYMYRITSQQFTSSRSGNYNIAIERLG
jgi:hypothetical protein